MRLRGEPEETAVSVERPLPAGFYKAQAMQVAPVDHAVGGSAARLVAVGNGNGGRAVMLHGNNRYGATCLKAVHDGTNGEFLQYVQSVILITVIARAIISVVVLQPKPQEITALDSPRTLRVYSTTPRKESCP